jgi:tetratricopeptide (TPR) repeat protein
MKIKYAMKHFLLIAGCLLSFATFAQKEVVSAYNANKDGNFREAATYIEQAILVEKSAIKDKTWRYRGEIYFNIATNPEVSAEFPNALVTARDSYLKARELDVKGRYETEILNGLARIQIQANNLGIEGYNTQTFDKAGSNFDVAAEIARSFNQVDTMAVYNAALCYEKAEIYDLAIARYYECAEIKYQVPNVFLFISSLHRKTGNEEAALETLQSARKEYPREQSLIIEELNIYLTNGDFEKAKTNLELAAEQDPTNEILWFSLGSVFDNLGNVEEAVTAYSKAIDVNADYFDANYNLGALYFNQAVQGINEANEMWKPRMTSKEAAAQKKLETDAKELFSVAKPYLEKAFELNSEDVSTIRSLKDIYARTGEDNKFLQMNDLLKTLQGK